jgi:hypothetical protein
VVENIYRFIACDKDLIPSYHTIEWTEYPEKHREEPAFCETPLCGKEMKIVVSDL